MDYRSCWFQTIKEDDTLDRKCRHIGAADCESYRSQFKDSADRHLVFRFQTPLSIFRLAGRRKRPVGDVTPALSLGLSLVLQS